MNSSNDEHPAPEDGALSYTRSDKGVTVSSPGSAPRLLTKAEVEALRDDISGAVVAYREMIDEAEREKERIRKAENRLGTMVSVQAAMSLMCLGMAAWNASKPDALLPENAVSAHPWFRRFTGRKAGGAANTPALRGVGNSLLSRFVAPFVAAAALTGVTSGMAHSNRLQAQSTHAAFTQRLLGLHKDQDHLCASLNNFEVSLDSPPYL